MSAQHDPVVRTTSGDVRGRWRGPSAAFLAIPYAEAPVGPLRFAAPVPRQPWEGVRDAYRYGPTAQVEPLGPVTTIPEPSTPGDDVLNLNVFTPDPGGAGLPVLVWIHGGGYMAGCQNSSWYDGATFNCDGIVTVSIGYRLGAEAWLHIDGAPDNRGALDWVAGLTWVRDNIAAFGGDPSRVTIAGQSAGGGAALDLLAMPSAEGLFVRAMGISSAIMDEDAGHAAELAQEFASFTGIPAAADSLKRIDRYELARLTKRFSAGPGDQADVKFAPFADGDVLPRPVVAALRDGCGRVPVLLGSTSHEFNMSGDAFAGLDTDEAARVLVGFGVGESEARRLAEEYAGRPEQLLGQALTDTTFRGLVLDVAAAHAATAPTWLYQFDWRSAVNGLAFHCLDLPFWWNRLAGERVEDATGPNPPQRLATAMHEAMVAFIEGGDPGWPAASVAEPSARLWQDPPTDQAGYIHVIGR